MDAKYKVLPARVAKVLVSITYSGINDSYKTIILLPVVTHLTQPLKIIFLRNTCQNVQFYDDSELIILFIVGIVQADFCTETFMRIPFSTMS